MVRCGRRIAHELARGPATTHLGTRPVALGKGQMIARGRLLTACLAMALLALCAQDAWSQRTIKLVVPVPAGASTDFVARLMAEQIARPQGVKIGRASCRERV